MLKKIKTVYLTTALTVIIALAGTIGAEAGTSSSQDFYDTYIADYIEIGFKVNHFVLDETSKRDYDKNGKFIGGFLGSIDSIEEEQSYIPTPYVRCNFNEYAGLELGWDRYEVKSGTYYDTSDGNFIYSGLSLQLRGSYPNESVATPYGVIGWSFLSGEVDYNPEWHQDGRRNFYTDDTVAFSVGGGCEFELSSNWSADVGVRYVKADFDVEYKLAAEPTSRGTFNFPLDNLTFHIGASYLFR